tara:strand:- start:177 stop:884 length:708 start_codon:yes stop_codon:yes gene_type:complete
MGKDNKIKITKRINTMSRLGKLKRQAINEANKRVLNEQSESQQTIREIKECLESIGYKEDVSAYRQNLMPKGEEEYESQFHKNLLRTPVGRGSRQLFMRKKSTFGDYEALAIGNSDGEFKFFIIDKEKMPQLPRGFQPFPGYNQYRQTGIKYPVKWGGDCERFKKPFEVLDEEYGTGEEGRDLISRIYAAKKEPDAWEEFKKDALDTGEGFKKMGEMYVDFWKWVGETALDWVTK